MSAPAGLASVAMMSEKMSGLEVLCTARSHKSKRVGDENDVCG